jgi:hypothetical protein
LQVAFFLLAAAAGCGAEMPGGPLAAGWGAPAGTSHPAAMLPPLLLLHRRRGRPGAALLLLLLLLLLLGAPPPTSAVRQAVQLCSCDPAHAGSQTWTWGQPSASADGGGGASTNSTTLLSEIRLKQQPGRCLFRGLSPAHPTYLYVDDCNSSSGSGGGGSSLPSASPLRLSFHSQHNPGLVRDTSVLTDASAQHPLCMDAAGMTANLQLWACIAGDDDQQYQAVGGWGLIVDLWTGFGNCVGVVDADDDSGRSRNGFSSSSSSSSSSSCAAPRGAHPPRAGPPPPPPTPTPATGGAPSTVMSPRYHLNDGPYRQSDPSGCIEINGTWFVFPDGSHRSVYTSTNLVNWVRRPTNIQFGETGGIGITTAGHAVTFGGGYHFTDLRADPYMASWKSADLGAGDPHVAHGLGQRNVFRNGDPSRPFLFEGAWYIVLGAGKNASSARSPPLATPGCVLCDVEWMQGELRLYQAADDSLTNFSFVDVIFATNETAGSTLGGAPAPPRPDFLTGICLCNVCSCH